MSRFSIPLKLLFTLKKDNMEDLIIRALLQNQFLESKILLIFLNKIGPVIRVMRLKKTGLLIIALGSYAIIANGHRIIKALIRYGPSMKTGIQITIFNAKYYALNFEITKADVVTIATMTTGIEAKKIYNKKKKIEIKKELAINRKCISPHLFTYLNSSIEMRFPKLNAFQ